MSSEEAIEQYQLQRCDICNRSFQMNSLEKHQKICSKVNSKKRTKFDSKKQRAVPLPEDFQGPKKPVDSTPKNNVFNINGTKFQRWPKPSEKLTRVPSKTRSLDDSIFRSGGKQRQLHSNKKAMLECPFCLRFFQEGSAERHIKFCEEVHSRIPVYNDNWDAKSKLAIRTQYQPPPPRQRKISNESRITPTPPRRIRHVAPVVEEGLTSSLPESFYHLKSQYTPTYNNNIEPSHLSTPSPRKHRSKMVTYGAVQPFSGPVISKENIGNHKNRFSEKDECKKPQRVYITDQDGYQNETRNGGQLIMYPDTISAQIQTDQLEVPVYDSSKVAVAAPARHMHPIYLQPYQRNTYSVPNWNPNWECVNPWYTEDSYLQMAPKIAAPLLYHQQWSPYPVLPNLSPRNYMADFRHKPRLALDYFQKESPRYHSPPPEQNLLSRDDTLLDNDYFGIGGSHIRNNHRYCGNCGARFQTYGSHYCSECGALNKPNK